MKVVYVVESLEMSGGVKVIVEHAEELSRRGHDVSIVTRHAADDWMPVGVPVSLVPSFSAETLPEADVHVATWFETVVPTLRAGRARTVVHFSQGYEAIYPWIAHRKAEIDEAYAQPVPKLLISAHLVGLFEGRFPGPFHVLPQAIRAADYAPGDPERDRPRQPPAIGIVGPFEALNKGIRVGLEAVSRLRDGGRPLRLHRASQMPLTDEERALLPCDVYAFRASVAEMVAWYHSSDVLVHPSFEAEGFPLPPLEAMAAGVPVVLTDIPSYAPIPADAAPRVPPGDAAAITREVGLLLHEPGLWVARRRRGIEVAATFSLARAIDALESALSAIVKG
ncbi:MAG: glycosyltransferase family 4 protein [Holophagales bacterium]|nr:glycosyltransferase family 4 protein [Holophagales bacterium]